MKSIFKKNQKKMFSYFFRSIFTLTLLASVACSNESKEELLEPTNAEVDIKKLESTNTKTGYDQKYYIFKSKSNGKVMQVPNTRWARTVTLDNYKSWNKQRWTIKTKGSYFLITNKATGRVLGHKNNTVKEQDLISGESSQLWKINNVDCENSSQVCKTLENKSNGKVATLSESNKVILRDYDENDDSHWLFIGPDQSSFQSNQAD